MTTTRLWLHRLRRRGKLVGVVAIVLIVSSTCTILRTTLLGRMSFSPPEPKTAGHLRLMTFNIAHGRGLAVDQRLVPDDRFRDNLDKIADFLSETQADIVALQEIDKNSSWNGNFDHLAYLSDQTTFGHRAYGLSNRNSGRYKLNYGNATLARHPIVSEAHEAFGDATLGEKGFLYTRHEVDGAPVAIINVHLDFRSEKRRHRQIEQLLQFIMERQNAEGADFVLPFIVGDFNSELSRQGGAVANLLAKLSELGAYDVVPGADERTFSVYHPATTIDLVFVPPAYAVQSVQVMPVRLSDHLPVIVDLLPASVVAEDDQDDPRD